MAHEIFRIENLVTEINGIETLSDFHLAINRGDLKGIYISQGNLKLSLVEVLSGKGQLLKGDFYIEDQPISFMDLTKYVYVIESKSKLIDSMSIANNIFIIRDGIAEQFLEDRILDGQVNDLLKKLELNIPVLKDVSKLTVYEKVIIEIVKAIGLGRKVILFKDLSSFLTDSELIRLNDVVRRLSDNHCSFLYVDSFLEVLEKMTDTIVWLKDGRNKWEFKEDLSDLLKNEKIDTDKNSKETENIDPIFSLEGSGLCIKASEGEIININDPQGYVLEQIIKTIQGQSHLVSFTLTLDGKDVAFKSSEDAVNKGVGFISDNPTKSMLIPHLNALDNLSYIVERKIKWFWMFKRYRLSILKHYEEKFEALSQDVYIDQLSIYDRQRLVYYKWHVYKPKVLFVYRPFTSIDQELRQLTYDLIKELSEAGITVILLTNNISEMKIAGRRFRVNSKK